MLRPMKTEMSAFDVLAIAKEMQTLVGGYLDKIFHWNRKNLLFRVNVPGAGRRELLLQELKWLLVTEERPDLPDTPSQFAVHLRKHLSNGRISAVSQKDFDRVIVLEVQKEKRYEIVFELFGEGNMVVVSEGKIVNCAVTKTWKHRSIAPGVEYSFPPQRFNPISAGYGEFVSRLEGSTSDVVRTLATSVNLGGQYAEEICLRAGIEKARRAKDLTEDERRSLYESLQRLLEEIGGAPTPGVFLEGGVPVDVAPTSLRLNSSLTAETFPSLSAALQSFLDRRPSVEPSDEDEEVQRLRRQLEQQSEVVEKLRGDVESTSSRAELLFTNYSLVSSIISDLSRMAGKATWDEMRRAGMKYEAVRDVDPPTHRVTLDISGTQVPLDYTKGVEENANDIYQRTKELRAKLNRATEALKGTEARIAEAKRGLERRRAEVKPKRTKEFWFESYKWFLTFGGRLVIAGRDARTNDQVVKKHLSLPDRFAHADVHGAPSVVIKDGAGATDEELREACVFAIAHSKAWNAGIGAGSAYWVLPDQVSKTPEAGEFVPKGAFVIRGRRNYFHHLPLELAVGEIQYEGARKIMCGPRASVETRSERFVVITPGPLERGKAATTLSRMFSVPEEEISRVLPPGSISIAEGRGVRIEGE